MLYIVSWIMNHTTIHVDNFTSISHSLKENFPFFEQTLIDQIEQEGVYKIIEEGEELIREGQFIKSFPLVLSGLVKISRQNEDGNELLLYYLKEKEVCSMSLTCCLSQTKSSVHAIAEQECQVILLKTSLLEEWMSRFPTWKQFVMRSVQSRFQELIEVVDSIAFLRMDERLIKHLKDRHQLTGLNTYHGSHQDLAFQLNTSREVVSRLLKKLEKDNRVKLARNFIDYSGLL